MGEKEQGGGQADADDAFVSFRKWELEPQDPRVLENYQDTMPKKPQSKWT